MGKLLRACGSFTLKWFLRDEMMYSLWSEQRDAYARRVNKVGRIILVILAIDGLHIAVQDSESQVRKDLFLGKQNIFSGVGPLKILICCRLLSGIWSEVARAAHSNIFDNGIGRFSSSWDLENCIGNRILFDILQGIRSKTRNIWSYWQISYE